MATLAEIRARLQAQDTRSNFGTPDKLIYPHWNIKEGESCLLRFLPDGNNSNTFFWAERAMIKLPFAGTKGGESKMVTVQVPCMEMWGEVCPVLTEVRPWFKDKSLEEMGRKYWKKRNYLLQGFVRENPIEKDEAPENPIRKFIMSPSLFTLIKAALLDPELEELPVDYERGLDFRIAKGSKGGYSDYGASKWSRRESALTADEQAVIEKYGLYDLNSWMPKKPTDVEVKVIKEMFEASVDGQSYDPERWGQYFKPLGGKFTDADDVETTATPVTHRATVASAPTVQKAESTVTSAPIVVETPEANVTKPKSSAEEILAQITARRNKAKS